jgi:hypothetical protein
MWRICGYEKFHRQRERRRYRLELFRGNYFTSAASHFMPQAKILRCSEVTLVVTFTSRLPAQVQGFTKKYISCLKQDYTINYT